MVTTPLTFFTTVGAAANLGTVDVIVIADVIVPVIVHVNGNAAVIVIRPVDVSHATVAPSGRSGGHDRTDRRVVDRLTR